MDSNEAMNVARLLHNVGKPGVCKGCNQPIIWVRHNSGASAPYDLDAVNHFVTCPMRDQFKKKKESA